MGSTLYLVVMVGIIALLVALIVPALFWKKCTACDARNIIDAKTCNQCGEAFPEDGGDVAGAE